MEEPKEFRPEVTILITRLLDEARAHGRTMQERDNALSVMEKAGTSASDAAIEVLALKERIAELHQRIGTLTKDLADSGEQHLAAIAALRDLSEATREYVCAKSSRKKARATLGLQDACLHADSVAKKAVPFR